MNEVGKTTLTLAAAAAGAWLLGRLLPTRPRYDFGDKVVLITGGSRGLGLVMARQLAREGPRLVLCARDQEELERASAELAQYGPRPYVLRCDVSDPAQVDLLVRACEARVGPVDVLINTAGTITMGPLEAMTRADFEEALANNFWGAFNTTQAVIPGMRQRQTGRIVNISSIGGKVSVPHLIPYSTSKFALVGYSHGLRAELAPQGIVVTTVCPGLMRTGSPRNAQFKSQHKIEYALFSILDSLPLFTISAEEAAAEIVAACRRGDAEAILSLPAQAAAKFQALFPETFADFVTLATRLLPGLGGIGTQALPGKDSTSPASPSFLTVLTERAAQRNNEMTPAER